MRFRYQLAFFADLTSLGASPETTMEIFQALNARNLGLLPSTLQELVVPNLPPVPRLRFSNPQSTLEINIPRGRLDIAQQYPAIDGIGLADVGQFADVAQSCIESVLGSRSYVAHRLALVTQDMLPEVGPEELRMQYGKLFRPTQFYATHVPMEWTLRTNAQVNLEFAGLTEVTNTITKIDRAQGEAGTPTGLKQFDRVMIETDINTLIQNEQRRFQYGVVRDFIIAAGARQDQLRAELEATLLH